MTVEELQQAIGATADGVFGPKSTAALLAHFTNRNAKAVNRHDMIAFASRLGCTVAQLAAVAAVESAGGGFDKHGRPKMLFERHLFHRLTDGKWSPTPYSQPAGGGYREDSWGNLAAACGKRPSAAFGACSWGRFQVLGLHAPKLGYPSSYALARSTVESEGEHYELLARYLETFGLLDELRALSADPEDCRAFAKKYNGPEYRRFNYHGKLARAMEASK